jgi:hypothetical protein
MGHVSRLAVVGITVALLAGARPGVAVAESTSQDVAYGVGSVTTTLVYAPIKASFCILGAVTSGLTLPFGGPRTAEKIASTACGGTWAITPAALEGREPVRFVGGSGGEASGRAAARR